MVVPRDITLVREDEVLEQAPDLVAREALARALYGYDLAEAKRFIADLEAQSCARA